MTHITVLQTLDSIYVVSGSLIGVLWSQGTSSGERSAGNFAGCVCGRIRTKKKIPVVYDPCKSPLELRLMQSRKGMTWHLRPRGPRNERCVPGTRRVQGGASAASTRWFPLLFLAVPKRIQSEEPLEMSYSLACLAFAMDAMEALLRASLCGVGINFAPKWAGCSPGRG